ELDNMNNPYNTYHFAGLPPGPIANPGRAAIEAVANPSRTDDLFFVADGTGGHVFAATYEEHQRNVSRWRQIERDEKAQAEQAAAEDESPADTAVVTPAGTPTVFDGLIEPNVEASDGAVVRELEGEVRGEIKSVPQDPLRGGLDLRLPR
ncbi:MAG: endolytic transglycosylase MltG, partial [Hyphomicrobiales bacterium]|nr:endolytic transglycosylase MltG [Hyphomicrobiales bacterium]